MDEALDFLADSSVDCVFVSDLSRLARSFSDLVEILPRFTAVGARIVTPMGDMDSQVIEGIQSALSPLTSGRTE